MARKKKQSTEIENQPNELIESLEIAELSNDKNMTEGNIFLAEETQHEGFLPDSKSEEDSDIANANADQNTEQFGDVASAEGTELEGFEAAEIEEVEFVEDERLESIIESILFASDRPVSLVSIFEVFKGTNIKKDRVRKTLDNLAVEYAGGRRGVNLEEVTGGYQLRTKVDNMNFLKRTVKARPFKLSGPALETLAIVAYKQPVIKMEVDQIRGVESGHLMRALMEKGLVNFEGKAENLPGKPMQYGTTRKFLEIFGLRNLKELPTLSQIDELLPEGIGEESEEKPTLSMVTDSMSEEVKSVSYSEGEEELGQIESELSAITTSSDFFEQEKQRQKQKRDEEKAQNIREALAVGEDVPNRDRNWLTRYEEQLVNPAPVVTVETLTDQTTANEGVEFILADADLTETVESTEVEMDASTSDEVAHIEDEIPFYDEADEDAQV